MSAAVWTLDFVSMNFRHRHIHHSGYVVCHLGINFANILKLVAVVPKCQHS